MATTTKLLAIATVITAIFGASSETFLFRDGFVRYQKPGKRQRVFDVKHIDQEIVVKKHVKVRFFIVEKTQIDNLYGQAVRNLENLKKLSMANCGIRSIDPEAFYNLPNLTVLNLQDNRIQIVKSGVFNNLPARKLKLQRNAIKKVDGGAFDNMPNLHKIKMNQNKLTSWDVNWFKNTPQLTEIYFRRNKISHLPEASFKNIKTSHVVDGTAVTDTKIFLSSNKLGRITCGSFKGLSKISQLFLDRNRLVEILDCGFDDLTEVDTLYLARNNLTGIDVEKAFPKLRKVGILDLSSNHLECVPYGLASVTNLTNFEENRADCGCVRRLQERLKGEGKISQIYTGLENC